MSNLYTYLPQDRLRALIRGDTLPDYTVGAALFADISGFTPLTETLTQTLGQRHGIEELTRQINAVYDALIEEIEKYGGSVIGFAGDAITCWFDHDTGIYATKAALALQNAMSVFPKLGLKIAVTTGPARRFAVGDPNIQLLDTLAGATIDRLATGEHLAKRGEVLLDTPTAEFLAGSIVVQEWRTAENDERFAVITELNAELKPIVREKFDLPANVILKPWVLPAVFEIEENGHGVFLTELRPVVALFLRFVGIDYNNKEAGVQLNTFVQDLQTITTRYGGHCLQITIGDKGSYAYVAFGALNAHEDDARRAVRAALELRDAAAKLDFLSPVQIGISQGTMRTGAYGATSRRTYGVLGDEVNLAARLMTKAMPGEILISRAIQKAVDADLVFKAYPPVHLKGKAEPVPIFAVIGERQQQALRLEEPKYALPMMGRKTELALIAEKLDLALQNKGQIIGITADAGMGKSRLVAETIRLANARGFAGYGGACESSGTNTPYLVWKPMCQAFFGVNSELALHEQIDDLKNKIEKYAPARVLAMPVLSIVLDIPIPENDFTRTLEPKDRRNVLMATLEDCLKSAAKEVPLLIVLEDLHWIDGLSYDLFEDLARISANLPVCFVLAYRPSDEMHSEEVRLERLPYFTRIPLNQLSVIEAEQLIRAKLLQLFPENTKSLPQALAAQLTVRAEGNPFYIEELLNYLHDQGFNPEHENPLDTIELPASLHTLILSRIDCLSESEKVIIKTASIIGRVFSVSWLQGYYPSLGVIDRIKADLVELAQLELTPLDRPEPELTYLFKHVVTREVAYQSLSYAMRAQLHEQLAGFIETLGADRYLDLLAFHYNLSENTTKQREYLQKAGDAAKAAFANEAALDYFTKLLPLLNDSHEQFQLYLKRGAVQELMGHWAQAETDYRLALAISERLGDAALIARCQQVLGKLFSERGDYAVALTWLSQARDTFSALNNRAGLAIALTEIGKIWWRQGNNQNGRRDLEAGLALAREIDDKATISLALNNLGLVALGLNKNNYSLAKELNEESLALRRKLGDRRGIAASLNNLGFVAHGQGEYSSARALLEESLSLFREIGDKLGIAISCVNLGNFAIEEHDSSSALAFYRESLALCKEMGNKIGMIYDISGIAAAFAQQNKPIIAAQLAAAAEKLRSDVGMVWDTIVERNIYEFTVNTARNELDDADFTSLWAKGEQMSLEEAINYALTA